MGSMPFANLRVCSIWLMSLLLVPSRLRPGVERDERGLGCGALERGQRRVALRLAVGPQDEAEGRLVGQGLGMDWGSGLGAALLDHLVALEVDEHDVANQHHVLALLNQCDPPPKKGSVGGGPQAARRDE